MENGYESIWGDLLSETEVIEEGIEGEEEIEQETQIRIMEGISAVEDASETTSKAFNELDDTNLEEDKLKEIINRALAINIDNKKGEVLIKVAKHSQAPVTLIREIRELICNEIDGESNKKRFLNEIDTHIEKIIEQSLEKLKDVNLKEEELEKMMQIVLFIKDDSAKCEFLAKVAGHSQTSMGVIEEAKLYISEIKNESIQKKYLKIIKSFFTNNMIIEHLLDNLNNLDFKETEPNAPEEIIKSVLKGKNDYQKGEILIKVAEHPQTSIWAVKEIMWQYYSGKIKNNDIIEENLSRLHKILDKKEEESGIKSQQIQQLEQYEEASEELSTGPIFAVLNDDDAHRKILDKEEENETKSQQTQQLKQCEGELGNLSISKNSKSNSRQ